jgi:hypothetical protein
MGLHSCPWQLLMQEQLYWVSTDLHCNMKVAKEDFKALIEDMTTSRTQSQLLRLQKAKWATCALSSLEMNLSVRVH